MRLTKYLLGYLNRVFSRDPQAFAAIQFSYAGTEMVWTVDDGILTVTVTGGIGSGFTATLANYTLSSLASYIAARAGFTVTAIAPFPVSTVSAKVLLDGTGRQSQGGNRLLGYSSILYSFMESAAVALNTAETDLVEALRQLAVRDGSGALSASGYWLEVIGGFYGIPRIVGEPDNVYGPRIIAEVLRAKGNNVALESAIAYYTGQQTTVVDVAIPTFTDPLYNAAHTHNSAVTHNSTGTFKYNLFDVTVGYDLLNGGDIDTFKNTVEAVVNRLRDAGMHMRSLLLTGSSISDAFTGPTDSFAILALGAILSDAFTGPTETTLIALAIGGFTDARTAPTDTTDTLDAAYDTRYSGTRLFNGAIAHLGGHTTHGDLAGNIGSIT